MDIKTLDESSWPLISIIIPCYNDAHYLPVAIESAIKQTYERTEIIVVDDGSSDNTPGVTTTYPKVKYVYQKNKGLSAARNFGVLNSNGEYLVFFDADDWLFPNAVETNISYFIKNPKLAVVSGAYDLVFTDKKIVEERINKIEKDHYCHLLQGNFIGVPAVAMVKRDAFEEFKFDESLKACEDYDFFLKVFRKYPVLHHTTRIAAYHKHSSNMSNNAVFMLQQALAVHQRQKNQIKNKKEYDSFKKGRNFWINYYCTKLYFEIKEDKVNRSKIKLFTLIRYKPLLMLKFLYSFYTI
ncbi:MAG: glycosyltransferase [Fulvivirga sp.]